MIAEQAFDCASHAYLRAFAYSTSIFFIRAALGTVAVGSSTRSSWQDAR
jgi:Na+/H+ antiporter NhaC